MHDELLEFEVGAGHVIKGFEDAVMGMEEGEEKEFKIQPSEAYGDPDPDLIKDFPKDRFPTKDELEKGMMLVIGLPDGKKVPATIKEVNDDSVSVDLNHPLCGKTLTFKIKIVNINS